jgi:hypothetical protein
MARFVIAAAAACALVGGCRTTAELEAERDAEFQTLVGGSMADFMRRTSLTPSDMYPTSSGRTFVVYGPASTIVLPGSGFMLTMAAHRQFKMLVETTDADGKGTADSWQVTRITRNGPC